MDQKTLERIKINSLSHQTLVTLFSSALQSSDISILSTKKNGKLKTTDYLVNLGENKLLIHAYLKNVCGSGFSWKPWLKRMQLTSFSQSMVPPINDKELFALVGITFVDDDIVIVFWNVFNYMCHKTTCSAYVTADNLIRGKEEGFRFSIDSENPVYIARGNQMVTLLNRFIKDCKVEEI